jgi:hypothetical protein
MNGYTDTYRQCLQSNWKITPSPPIPSIQRFPPSPCISDPDANSPSTYSRFDFNFDFGYTGSPLKSSPSPSSSPIASLATLARPRKAPLPPVYSPRRARARHIRMQEPAKLGLFTVSEEEVDSSNSEETETEWYCDLSTPISYSSSYSSTSTSPSQSESESGSEVDVETPNGEFDDPFSTPPTTLSITSPFTRPRPPPPTLRTVVPVPTLAAAVNAGNYQPRRPPPLELHLITRPADLPHLDIDALSLSPSPLSFHCQLNSAGGLPLAAALPIRNSPSCSTPQKRRSPDSEVDLVSALEELFTSCGEDLDTVGSIGVDDFPLPPSRSIPSISVSKSKSRSLNTSPTSTPLPQFHRTPVTPPPTRLSLSPCDYQPPAAPRQKSRRVDTSRPIKLTANHSFLLDMARSPSSSSSSSNSSGSTGSSRSLPRRGAIPAQWANVNAI